MSEERGVMDSLKAAMQKIQLARDTDRTLWTLPQGTNGQDFWLGYDRAMAECYAICQRLEMRKEE